MLSGVPLCSALKGNHPCWNSLGWFPVSTKKHSRIGYVGCRSRLRFRGAVLVLRLDVACRGLLHGAMALGTQEAHQKQRLGLGGEPKRMWPWRPSFLLGGPVSREGTPPYVCCVIVRGGQAPTLTVQPNGATSLQMTSSTGVRLFDAQGALDPLLRPPQKKTARMRIDPLEKLASNAGVPAVCIMKNEASELMLC